MTKDTKRDDTLRSMVREVLQDVLSSRGRTKTEAAATAEAEPVRLETDAELQAFLRRVTDPATAEAIRSGRLDFMLASGNGTARREGILDGVITEQKIDALAVSGTLVLGPGAVLTPLAKDRARRLGLKIERRR
jgi:hypothetical protein